MLRAMNQHNEREQAKRIKRATKLHKMHQGGKTFREIAAIEGISAARVHRLVKSLNSPAK